MHRTVEDTADEGRAERALSARLNAAIDKAIAEKRIVGTVVLVAHDGKVIFRRAAGLADREARAPMREDQVFRLSSITKPFVSAAAMALLERGQIRLEDPVTRWIPDFRPRLADGRTPVVTLRHLLTHTSGLSYGFSEAADGPYHQAGVSEGLEQPGLAMDEQLRRLGSVPLLFAPGERWNYSLGLDVLGEVMARAAGATLPEVVGQFVTGPLGMVDTAFHITDATRVAVPYVDGQPEPARMNQQHIVPFGDGAGIRFSLQRIFDQKSFPSGGAGMAGTAGDTLVFLETIRRGGGPILTPESARAMMSHQIGELRVIVFPTPAWGFGFGGAVLLDPALDGGPYSTGTWRWGGVYGHQWFVDPVARLSVVALSNTTVEGMVGAYTTDLSNAVYGRSA
jgi:CubicO group peptidase (beta-lactamase class C family)